MTEFSQSQVQATYDEIADAYADHFPSTEPEARIELAMIEQFVELLDEPRRVLDAGCGTGRMMPFLAERGCAVEGVDLSAEMIRHARADHPEFPVRVASLTDLPFADATFDGVFSWYSTIHSPIDQLCVMLSQMHRVLLPKGLVLIAFQSGRGIREVGAGIRRLGIDVQMYRHHRTVQEFGTALADAGFAIVATLDRQPLGDEPEGLGVVIGRRVGSENH